MMMNQANGKVRAGVLPLNDVRRSEPKTLNRLDYIGIFGGKLALADSIYGFSHVKCNHMYTLELGPNMPKESYRWLIYDRGIGIQSDCTVF